MRMLRHLITAALCLLICACGGNGSGGAPARAPVITSQPASVSVYDTDAATFQVVASDAGPINYQWKKNGIDIEGATASSWTNPSSLLTDDGSQITVAVTGTGGVTVSSIARLTVIDSKPQISSDPAPQSTISGGSVYYTVSATGRPPLSYQWYKNDQKIPGANSSSYKTSVTLGDNGANYRVEISNKAGAIYSKSAQSTVHASELKDIVISEVSTCYYFNVDCWFEIYNPTNSVINLSGYSIKSTSIDVTQGGNRQISIFSLPEINLGPDSYIIVSGNKANAAQRGTQNIRLRTGNIVPYWNSSGFIEIMKPSAVSVGSYVTVDFIPLGRSTQLPVTGAWSGNPVQILSSANDYGKSVVRPYPQSANTNTNSAADWIAVNWVTPGGRNDVPADARDDDGDGIPDSAEVLGGTFAGLDLYSMGARLGQKDIFIELDHMDSKDPWINPNETSLNMVKKAFAAKNINIIFDVGDSFSSIFSPERFNFGQSNNIVPYEPCVTLSQVTCVNNISGRRSIYDWKDEYMDIRRRPIFHYLLIGSSQQADGTVGSSGIAELPGNDILVTMGGWYLAGTPEVQSNKITNYQAGTIMHELGHNLGLRHGGDEDQNLKPNYWSVMNYLYQLQGLDPDPKSATAYQRWSARLHNTPAFCNLVASSCGDPKSFVINYSDGLGKDLNEDDLLESDNIGHGIAGGAYADWDLNGIMTSNTIKIDLNQDGSSWIFHDYNDWANLNFPFSRYFNGNAGSYLSRSPQVVVNPVVDDRQNYIIDTLTAPR